MTQHSPTQDDVRAYLRENHRAVLGTRRRDGGMQLSPVTVVLDPDDATLLISTRETAIKTANLRRDPFAYLCVFSDSFFGPWVQAEGRVTIKSLPDAMDDLVRYYRLARGEHPDWEEYRAAMVRERRVLVRLTVERVGPTRSG